MEDTEISAVPVNPRNSFLQKLKDYKELASIAAAAVAALFFVMDYFATKKELGIVRCQMTALVNIQHVRDQVTDIDDLNDSLVSQIEAPSMESEVREKLKEKMSDLKARKIEYKKQEDLLIGQISGGVCDTLVEGQGGKK